MDGVTRSLRVGVVQRTRFTVEIHTDVFKMLFDGKGEKAKIEDACISLQILTRNTFIAVGISIG